MRGMGANTEGIEGEGRGRVTSESRAASTLAASVVGSTVSGPFIERSRAVFLEHALLFGLLAAYFLAVAAFVTLTGTWDRWVIRWSYSPLVLIFCTGSVARLLTSRESRRAEHLAGAALIGAIAAPFQSTFNSVKQLIDDVVGYPWDNGFAEIDRVLHFGRHPWQWLSPLIDRTGVIRLIDLSYMLWFPVVFAFVLWVAWTRHRDLRRRALVAVMLVWVLCGNVAALIFASAGPCYYGAVSSGTDPYAGLLTTLDAQHRHNFLFARHNQTGLWTAMQSNDWLPFGGISAMPSVHVAMVVLMALVARARNATAGVLLSVFAMATMLGSVMLAWHYAIDGYLGALMAYGIWRGVNSRVPLART